jgi:hypothetical protein
VSIMNVAQKFREKISLGILDIFSTAPVNHR